MSTVDIDKPSKFDKSLEALWAMWRELETYRLVFGNIIDPTGKIDTLSAYRSFKEDEPHQESFKRYLQYIESRPNTLKAELLAKMPKLEPACGEGTITGDNKKWWCDTHKARNDTITEITKIVNEL